MNLHEYQAKELLKSFDLPVLKGKTYFNKIHDIAKDLLYLGNPPWIIKSQIHAGGRGAGYFKNVFNNKGGVQVANNKEELVEVANSMLGNMLITKQTGIKGQKVNKVFVEQSCEIKKEFYLSLLIDRNNSQLMLLISSSGGMDIEEIAKKEPEKIHITYFSNYNEINLDKDLQFKLEINLSQFQELELIVKKLVKAFISLDASTIEINPLVLNSFGNFILLDSKLILDDNALFRHPDLVKLKDISEENSLELKASESGMNYVKLEGFIGCMVNGAGLAMATMDIIKLYGGEPANFLDLGGSANKERTIEGFNIIQSDTNVKSVLVNIFGGIIHCDMIASGIIEAIEELDFKLPLVVRLQGTNASQGRDIINRSSINVIFNDDLGEAAKKVVELAK